MASAVIPEKGSILIVRPDAIGDLVLTLPLASAIKKYWPDTHITFLINPAFYPIVDKHPSVDAWIPDPKNKYQLQQQLLNAIFNVAFLPYLEADYAWAVKNAAIPIRVGDAKKQFLARYLTHKIPIHFHEPHTHIIEHNLRLLHPFGITDANGDLTIAISDNGRRALLKRLNDQQWSTKAFIFIQPCTGGSDREWLPSSFVALIDLIYENTSYDVLISGAGDREEAIVQEIVTQCRHRPLTLTGFGTLDELKAAIELSAAVIGTNTGPIHIAAAIGKPVISLFPSKFIKPSLWGPWGCPGKIVRNTSDCPLICHPHRCKETYCLKAIEPKTVMAALMDILADPESAKTHVSYDRRLNTLSVALIETRKNYVMIDRIHAELTAEKINHYRFKWSLYTIVFLWRWIGSMMVANINVIHIPSEKKFWPTLLSFILSLRLSSKPIVITQTVSEKISWMESYCANPEYSNANIDR